jgi:hypothetical protein
MINKKLGYYTCNGQEFSSKIRCALHASEVNQPLAWQFNNDAFQQHKWHVEPIETLDQLYDRRAREIREKYDYVVLNYSGGSDCHNILKSFYRQGLLLDEVVSNWIFEASKNVTVIDPRVNAAWNQNAEFELNAKEKLQWITDNMPKTKISIYDCGSNVYKYFSNAEENWILDAMGPVNPAAVQRYNSLSIKDIRTRIDRQRSVCTIIGIDKPRCWITNNQLYLVFMDTIANIIPVGVHMDEYDNHTIENFYWSPESCDMISKQCHAILNFLKASPQLQRLWAKDGLVAGANQVREDLLKNILYTTWDNSFQVIKPVGDWYSEYDYWFTTQLINTKAGKNWSLGIKYLKEHIHSDLFSSESSLEACLSPEYYIGDIV